MSGRADRRLPWILRYHSVIEYLEDPFLITLTPQRFEGQLRGLRRVGLRGAAVRKVLAARSERRGMVALTFDDGYADLLDAAVPILEHHDFGATLFAVSRRLGDRNDWESRGPTKAILTEEQPREVASGDIDVGSHSISHPDLEKASSNDAGRERRQSRRSLERLLACPVPGFASPYGPLGRSEAQLAREAGHDYACAIWISSDIGGRMALPRSYVGERDHGLHLAAKRARFWFLTRGRTW